jgi:hypothetical protein
MTGRRRARIETTVGDTESARQIATALAPDNTAEMETVVEDSTVRTTIARESTGSLQATIDDYVVNLQVAVQLTTQDGDSSTTTQTIHE